MLGRRIVYLMSLIGCFVFYIAYREWMAWLFLVAMLALPWLSLLMSLPSMLSLKAYLTAPKAVRLGSEISLGLRFRCRLPIPPVSWKYLVQLPYTDACIKVKPWQTLTANHCGCMEVELVKAWKYDFLGLFRWPLCKKTRQKIWIYPKEIQIETIPSLKKILIPRWKAKGSGFAENYDLRPYRPGDSLRQIHWKLSAKIGKIIYREAIVPVHSIPIITMIFGGELSEIDEKLGKFMYLSKFLLHKELTHELHCLSAEGLKIYRIVNETELYQVITQLLHATRTESKQIPYVRAVWKYHIGGEADEE